jgi:hypothetical protein
VVVGTVLLAGVAILVTLRFTAIKDPTGKEAFSQVKDILTLLLPVFGTWIGTVLAFYFTKENLEAASNNMNKLVNQVVSMNQRFEAMYTKDVMARFPNFTFKYVKDEAGWRALKLTELIALMESTGTERLPIIIEGADTFHFLIYRSTIERFIAGLQNGSIKLEVGSTSASPNLTINDLAKSDFKVFKWISELNAHQPFVSPDAKLSEVQKYMQDLKYCQDVFVTSNGQGSGKLLGWVTDENIADKAELFTKSTGGSA